MSALLSSLSMSLIHRFLAKSPLGRLGQFPPIFSLQPRRHRPKQVETGLGLALLHKSESDDRAGWAVGSSTIFFGQHEVLADAFRVLRCRSKMQGISSNQVARCGRGRRIVRPPRSAWVLVSQFVAQMFNLAGDLPNLLDLAPGTLELACSRP